MTIKRNALVKSLEEYVVAMKNKEPVVDVKKDILKKYKSFN